MSKYWHPVGLTPDEYQQIERIEEIIRDAIRPATSEGTSSRLVRHALEGVIADLTAEDEGPDEVAVEVLRSRAARSSSDLQAVRRGGFVMSKDKGNKWHQVELTDEQAEEAASTALELTALVKHRLQQGASRDSIQRAVGMFTAGVIALLYGPDEVAPWHCAQGEFVKGLVDPDEAV